MKEIKATKKAISARVNRAAWDWLEVNGVNKNALLNDLISQATRIMQHNEAALHDYITGATNAQGIFDYYD